MANHPSKSDQECVIVLISDINHMQLECKQTTNKMHKEFLCITSGFPPKHTQVSTYTNLSFEKPVLLIGFTQFFCKVFSLRIKQQCLQLSKTIEYQSTFLSQRIDHNPDIFFFLQCMSIGLTESTLGNFIVILY